jgi:hypothetical protein
MRILIAAIVVALLSGGAQAQGMARHAMPPPRATQKPVDQAKTKAADKAYKDALKRIPNSNAPDDPWKGMR